jgi:hypothetical protein
MKKVFQLFLAATIFFSTSCSKEEDSSSPIDKGGNDEVPIVKEFNVTTEGTTFKVGERVRFTLEGDPEAINFYSGEMFQQYAFKDGRVGTVFNPLLSFSLYTPSNTRRDQFFVMVSNDFDGDYSSLTSVKEATWVNVTNKMTFPSLANTYTSSGNMDLSEYTESGKPFYFAFKYVNAVNPDNSVSALAWTVRNVSLKNALQTGLINLAGTNTSDFSFQVVKQSANSGTVNLTATDRFPMTGNVNAPREEFWAVSKAFEGEEIELGGDKPVPIKSIGNSKLSSYSFVYNKQGVYPVTFEATVREADGSSRLVTKNIELNIIP